MLVNYEMGPKGFLSIESQTLLCLSFFFQGVSDVSVDLNKQKINTITHLQTDNFTIKHRILEDYKEVCIIQKPFNIATVVSFASFCNLSFNLRK